MQKKRQKDPYISYVSVWLWLNWDLIAKANISRNQATIILLGKYGTTGGMKYMEMHNISENGHGTRVPCTPTQLSFIHLYTYECTHSHTYIHTHICAYIQTYICVYIHIIDKINDSCDDFKWLLQWFFEQICKICNIPKQSMAYLNRHISFQLPQFTWNS